MADGEREGVLGGGHDGGGSMRWLLTYADLITLMMVFFVVMYSMANVDKQKYAAVAGALRKAFGGDRVVGLPGTGTGEGGGSGGETTPGAAGGARKDPLMTLAEQLTEVQQRLMAGGQLPRGAEMPLQVYLGPRGLTISLAGSALFSPDDARIRPEALPVLAAVAQVLRGADYQISIEGFEADLGNADSFARAWRLSQERAAAVTRYLTEAQGLPPDHLVMAAYGQWRPVIANTTEAGRAANRRVDLVVLRAPPDLDRGLPVQPRQETDAAPAK